MDLLAHHYAYLSLPEAIRRVYDHRIWSSGRQGVKHRKIDTCAPSTQSFNLRFGVRVCIKTLLNLLILFVVRTDRPLEILQPNSADRHDAETALTTRQDRHPRLLPTRLPPSAHHLEVSKVPPTRLQDAFGSRLRGSHKEVCWSSEDTLMFGGL